MVQFGALLSAAHALAAPNLVRKTAAFARLQTQGLQAQLVRIRQLAQLGHRLTDMTGAARRAFGQRWKRVAVVTSPMHSRRACATVEGTGLAVTCVVAPWRPAAWPARTAGDRIVVMQRLVYETLAWAQYRVSGWATWG